ncbi:uncharacterized protein LOC144785698 [Lissotriton helveticus]
MAAATPLMPAHHHGARLYMRNLLEEACERLLRRLREDDLPTEKSPTEKSPTERSPTEKDKVPECDGVKRCVDQLLKSIGSLKAPRDPREVHRLLSETCGCDLLPPGVLETLVPRLIQYNCALLNDVCPNVVRTLQRVLLHEEKLAAFFTDETGLSLLHEIRGLLRGRHWDRLRIRQGYLAEFTGAEDEPRGAAHPEVQVRGDPLVQLSTGGGNTAEPEVHISTVEETYTPANRVIDADPEVHRLARTKTNASLSGADPEVDAPAAKREQRVDLAIGDRRTKLGFYIELKKNPKDKKALQLSRDKLRAILSAKSVSAPGNFNTTEENRVCYQIILYTPGGLAKGSQRPGEMEKLLSKQTSWMHVIDCYDETWRLPKREVGACIMEVRPDF